MANRKARVKGSHESEREEGFRVHGVLREGGRQGRNVNVKSKKIKARISESYLMH